MFRRKKKNSIPDDYAASQFSESYQDREYVGEAVARGKYHDAQVSPYIPDEEAMLGLSPNDEEADYSLSLPETKYVNQAERKESVEYARQPVQGKNSAPISSRIPRVRSERAGATGDFPLGTPRIAVVPQPTRVRSAVFGVTTRSGAAVPDPLESLPRRRKTPEEISSAVDSLFQEIQSETEAAAAQATTRATGTEQTTTRATGTEQATTRTAGTEQATTRTAGTEQAVVTDETSQTASLSGEELTQNNSADTPSDFDAVVDKLDSLLNQPASTADSTNNEEHATKTEQAKESVFKSYEGKFAHLGESAQPVLRSQYDEPITQFAERDLKPYVEENVKVHRRELLSAAGYDELVNWSTLLTKETPLYQRAFSLAGAKSIVDVGCGSGRHSVMFAEWGLKVLGIDSDEETLARARSFASESNLKIIESRGTVSFSQGSIGSISRIVGPEKTEAIVCVGDVLPRVESLSALRATLRDFADSLVSAGVLVLEFSNHTHFAQQRIRSATPAVFDTVEGTKAFLRIIDYPAANTIVDVDLLTLTRHEDGSWSVSSDRSPNLFISPTGITRELFDAGFDVLELSGDYNGRELNQYEDEHIVVIARRKRYRSTVS